MEEAFLSTTTCPRWWSFFYFDTPRRKPDGSPGQSPGALNNNLFAPLASSTISWRKLFSFIETTSPPVIFFALPSSVLLYPPRYYLTILPSRPAVIKKDVVRQHAYRGAPATPAKRQTLSPVRERSLAQLQCRPPPAAPRGNVIYRTRASEFTEERSNPRTRSVLKEAASLP